MENTFIEKINNYRRAAYPLLYIQTSEESRIIKELTDSFATTLNVLVWDEMRGLMRHKGAGKTELVNLDIANVGKLMESMIKIPSFLEEKSMFIFKDFHFFLKNSKVTRCFKEMALMWKACGSTAVFISPIQELPPELIREFQVVEYALPDEATLTDRLDYVHQSLEMASKQKVSLSKKIKEAGIAAAKGMTRNEAENAFSFSVVTNHAFDEAFVKTVFEEKIQHIKKNGFLTYLPPDIGFANVGGLGQLKQWIRLRANSFSKAAREYGLPFSKGVLLAGVAGCGKTMIAKATSKEFNMPLFQLDVGALFGSLVGQTEQNCRAVIKTIESIGQCVILIDELEKSLNNSATSGAGDSGTSSRMFGTFLSWLNDRICPAFIMATSNNLLVLPPELIRKGRLDETFWLDLPEADERRDIWNVVIKKYKRDVMPVKFDLAKLAEKSANYTGSEIDCAFVSAMFKAFSGGKEVSMLELLEALDETIPQAKVNEEQLARMREFAKGRLRNARELTDKEYDQKAIEEGFRMIDAGLELDKK